MSELSAASAKKLVNEIAENSENVFFTKHARVRMKERRITSTQVLECLKKGSVIEEPVFDAGYDSWEIKFECLVSGDVVRVVAALKKEKKGYVVVVTTYKGG